MPPEKSVPFILRPIPVVIAILAVGPFALPLVWVSPAFGRIQKLCLTVIILALSVWLYRSSAQLYSLLSDHMTELQQVLKQ